MSNYQIKYTKEFKKSLKKLAKQGKNIDKLFEVIEMLSTSKLLDSKYKDHCLYNDKWFKDCRDCHIELDWLLVYKFLDNDILLLVNTGSHANVLNK